MTPAARLQLSIALSEEIAADPRPADAVVADFLKARRFIGAGDRRALTQLVYDRVRRQARIEWWLGQVGLTASHRHRALAELLLTGVKLDALERLCNGSAYAPEQMVSKERQRLATLEGKPLSAKDQPPAVRGESPDWLLPLLPGDSASLLEALAQEAPLDLRVNGLLATRDLALERLRAEGLDASPTALSPLGIRIAGRRNVAATEASREGLGERQDEGSQIAALLADARPGQRVLDFCAGAGGKTLALAAAMQNKGTLIATDVLQGRLDRSAQRLRRAEAHNVTRRALKDHRDPWLKRHKGSFDRVLIDAPCSGVGAWRRNPDARWRLRMSDIEELTALQAEILDSAQRLVKPGGRLTYVTCSLLPAENQAQVAKFLEKHPAFSLKPIPTLWADVIGGSCPSNGEDLTLRPDREGTDGFYVAVLERSASEAAEPSVAAR